MFLNQVVLKVCAWNLNAHMTSNGLFLKSVGVSQFLDFIPCSKNMFWKLDLFLPSGGKVGKAPILN